jgi:threonylcarbamoyladenosine tRNA methylthiotransferase MtaB
MNRGYTKEEIFKKITRIKKMNPKAFIGTDIIVGFPGETEREFKETYEFLKNAPIDKVHVFRFSSRPGTAAEKFKNIYKKPTPQEKHERAQLILLLNDQKNKRSYHLK